MAVKLKSSPNAGEVSGSSQGSSGRSQAVRDSNGHRRAWGEAIVAGEYHLVGVRPGANGIGQSGNAVRRGGTERHTSIPLEIDSTIRMTRAWRHRTYRDRQHYRTGCLHVSDGDGGVRLVDVKRKIARDRALKLESPLYFADTVNGKACSDDKVFVARLAPPLTTRGKDANVSIAVGPVRMSCIVPVARTSLTSAARVNSCPETGEAGEIVGVDTVGIAF